MTTTYCTIEDVSDYLRVPITATTSPNKIQVEKIINRKEAEFERRVGHTWGIKQSKNEVYDLPLNYVYGWGTPINLKHRMILPINSAEGDKVEMWSGMGGNYEDITAQGSSTYSIQSEMGKLFFRGYLFSTLREFRLRITYRYGGDSEAGDGIIPPDVKDAIIKMVCLELMNTMFRMDEVPSGGMIDLGSVKRDWKDDIETCIENRREVFVIP